MCQEFCSQGGVCSQGGALSWGVPGPGGGSAPGRGCLVPGGCLLSGGCLVPGGCMVETPPTTTAAVGTHPTGMHSCAYSFSWSDLFRKPRYTPILS